MFGRYSRKILEITGASRWVYRSHPKEVAEFIEQGESSNHEIGARPQVK